MPVKVGEVARITAPEHLLRRLDDRRAGLLGLCHHVVHGRFAVAVLRHGRLHRYNVAAGELGETALLEQEFAAYTGAKYALAVASGGYAMATALRARFFPGEDRSKLASPSDEAARLLSMLG